MPQPSDSIWNPRGILPESRAIPEAYIRNATTRYDTSLPSYVCMHLPTPVVESANFVMHASSLSYPSSSPTMHAESSTIEHLDEDWQPRCTTRAVNLRTGVERTCTAPAKWFHVCGVCSLDGYSCDRCRRHAIERARCYGCMRWIADYWTWRPL